MDISARHNQHQRCGQLGQWLDWMLLSSIFPSSSKLTFQQMMNGSVAQHPCFVSSMRKLGPFPLPKTDCWWRIIVLIAVRKRNSSSTHVILPTAHQSAPGSCQWRARAQAVMVVLKLMTFLSRPDTKPLLSDWSKSYHYHCGITAESQEMLCVMAALTPPFSPLRPTWLSQIVARKNGTNPVVPR